MWNQSFSHTPAITTILKPSPADFDIRISPSVKGGQEGKVDNPLFRALCRWLSIIANVLPWALGVGVAWGFSPMF